MSSGFLKIWARNSLTWYVCTSPCEGCVSGLEMAFCFAAVKNEGKTWDSLMLTEIVNVTSVCSPLIMISLYSCIIPYPLYPCFTVDRECVSCGVRTNLKGTTMQLVCVLQWKNEGNQIRMVVKTAFLCGESVNCVRTGSQWGHARET